MVELIRGLDPDRVRENLARVRAEVGAEVEVVAAVKYVAEEELGVLVEAGLTLVGENRAQALAAKAATPSGAQLTWDFIGHLQSRKVASVLEHARLVHSVGSDSVLERLRRHPGRPEVLVEVNIAQEDGKSGVAPDALDDFLERAADAAQVTGLMTMPPASPDPEGSRRWFAALAQLAADRGLTRLSMGTTQDYAVAAQEGATIVRVGSTLFG